MMEGNLRISSTIPGVIVNSQNSQLLVSSGIPTLDQLLGGGVPVGSLVLVEEDVHGSYAKVLLKYFLAEGVVNKQPLFVCSKEVNPESIVKDLPALIDTDPEPDEKITDKNKMTIAFRYHNLPTKEEVVQQHFGHYYDLSKCMPYDKFEGIDLTYWQGCENTKEQSGFENSEFLSLLEPIKYKLKHEDFDINSGPKAVMRIVIHSLASPLWFLNHNSNVQSLMKDMNLFLYALKGLIRYHSAVAVVTVPSHLYQENFITRCIHSSDIALHLESFGGTVYENNKILSDYHGFFHITKVAAINSLVSKHPGAIEYVFKLKKKKFKIQKLHLPPDLQDSNDGQINKGRPEFACGGHVNKLLDF